MYLSKFNLSSQLVPPVLSLLTDSDCSEQNANWTKTGVKYPFLCSLDSKDSKVSYKCNVYLYRRLGPLTYY